MNFDTVHLISQHIEPIPLSEVERVETTLGITLPTGYTAFITRFGLGEYCDYYRIYSPEQILKDYAEHRNWWKDSYYSDTVGKRHWFFEGSEAILSEAELQDSFIIGDSNNGDQLVFYPPRPDKIYILPRHDDKIFAVNADFSDLHHWDTDTPLLLTFAPWHRQATLNFLTFDFTLDCDSCLAQFKARSDGDSLLMLQERSDAWSWLLIFFLTPIGARVQVIQDEGVTRTYATDEHGSTATIQGSGKRTLNTRIDCDEESAAEVNAFFAHLEAQGLITLLKPDAL